MSPVHKHKLEKELLHICCETGPTGFVLARRLLKLDNKIRVAIARELVSYIWDGARIVDAEPSLPL